MLKTRRISCIGIGSKFYEMVKLYQGRNFLQRIEYLYDNNVSLWGKSVELEGHRLLVHSPDALRQMGNERILLMVTTNRVEEIAEQLKILLPDRHNIVCSKCPGIYYKYTRILQKVFYYLPVAKRFLFHVASSEPRENTKAIIYYLKQKKSRKDIIFLTDRKVSKAFLRWGKILKKDTIALPNRFFDNLRYCYYYATASVVFYENTPIFKTNKYQRLVFLNHGTLPLKNVRGKMVQPVELDYAVCPSRFCAEIYEEQYSIPKKKLLFLPPPRLDWLQMNSSQKFTFLPREQRKIIIWLPTFRILQGKRRKDGKISPFGVPLVHTCAAWGRLNEILEKYHEFLIIKLHPREEMRIQLDSKLKNIRVIQEEELSSIDATLQELLSQTDALLTDYSGIAFEYLIVNRPIGYILEDVEEYLPGFAMNNPEDFMPGEKIYDMKEMEQFLCSIAEGEDSWRKKREKLRDKLFPIRPKSCAGKLIDELEERYK